jgi:hypothetical protein
VKSGFALRSDEEAAGGCCCQGVADVESLSCKLQATAAVMCQAMRFRRVAPAFVAGHRALCMAEDTSILSGHYDATCVLSGYV